VYVCDYTAWVGFHPRPPIDASAEVSAETFGALFASGAMWGVVFLGCDAREWIGSFGEVCVWYIYNKQINK
jgi:hypothetical protein